MKNMAINLLKIIQDLFSGYKENKSHYIVNCPSCDREKLYVDKKEHLFICFRCGIRGNLTKLVMYILSYSYSDAYRYLYGETRTKISEQKNFLNKIMNSLFRQNDTVETVEITQEFPKDYKPIEFCSKDSPGRDYLLTRNIDIDSAIQFDLGYSESLKRIIFPVLYDNELVGYQGRDITGSQSPKMLNSRDFIKTKYLYGYDQLDRTKDSLIICEGPIDCIKSSKFNSVALFGKHISKEQFNLTLNLNLKRVYIGLDPDTHNVYQNGKMVNLAEEMASKFMGFIPEIFILQLEKGLDLGDLTEEEIKGYLVAAEGYKRYLTKLIKI